MSSRITRFILLLIVGIALTFGLLSLNVPMWLTVAIIFLFYMAFSIGWPFFIIYKTRSVKMVDRYISGHRRKPIFGYSYALAHGTDEDVISWLKAIIDRYPQKEMQEVYQGNLAIFERDPKALFRHAEQMTPSEYRVYFLALAHIMKKEIDRAEIYKEKLQTPWTRHMIDASIAHRLKDLPALEEAIDRAVQSTRGLQRYSLYHTGERMKKEIK